MRVKLVHIKIQKIQQASLPEPFSLHRESDDYDNSNNNAYVPVIDNLFCSWVKEIQSHKIAKNPSNEVQPT